MPKMLTSKSILAGGLVQTMSFSLTMTAGMANGSAAEQRVSRLYLTIQQERMTKAQLKIYAWCAAEQRENYNWIAFFDLDESLVLRDAGEHREPPNLRAFWMSLSMSLALSSVGWW
jgi:hypothetical protein